MATLRGFPATRGAALAAAAAALLVLPLGSVVTAPGFLRDADSYLQVHTLLEFFAVGVSLMIAGIGWSAIQGKRSAHMAVTAAGFLSVGILDLAHLLSYSGMPDLVTPSGTEKAILLWLAARFACAATLLFVVAVPGSRVAGPRTRAVALGGSLIYSGTILYLVLLHQDWLPRTFIAGQGLTQTKIVAEYAVMGLLAATALLLWVKRQDDFAFRGPPLLAALLILAAGEIALTLYTSAHDIYNFVGHLYKVAATYLIYRAVFVDAVEWPYLRLRLSEEKYRMLLQQAADSILLIGSDGRILDANLRAEVMTGLDRGALVGRNIEQLIPDWISPTDTSPATIWEGHLTPPRDSRQRDAIDIEVSARRLNTGEAQAIIRDISERKASEAKLRTTLALAEQTNKAKSAFLANMSHELRTPLNAVLGFSEMIRNQVLGHIEEQRYCDYATDIHKAGTHLLAIVDDVLDLARVESGRLELDEREVNVTELIDECVRLTLPGAGRISLTTAHPPGPLTVRADARALRQVLLNLLSNAVKFTPAGGRIEVASGVAANGAIEIAVRDTGIGIAASDLPHVTEAYVQGDPARARRNQGSGLGLAISKALVELHGGALRIASTVGAGTTVTVVLPRERLSHPTLAALA